jgi:hypothetical protein
MMSSLLMSYPYCQLDIVSINVDQFDFKVHTNGSSLFIVECVISKTKQQTERTINQDKV